MPFVTIGAKAHANNEKALSKEIIERYLTDKFQLILLVVKGFPFWNN